VFGEYLDQDVFEDSLKTGDGKSFFEKEERLISQTYTGTPIVMPPGSTKTLLYGLQANVSVEAENIDGGAMSAVMESAFENTATLRGFAVYNAQGQFLPNAQVVSGSGTVFPVIPAPKHIMLSPIEVIGSDLGSFNDTVPFVNMINQSGVEKPFESGWTDFDVYFEVPRLAFAMSGTGGTNNWQSSKVATGAPLEGYVDFDLGSPSAINKLAIWNVEVKDVTVRIADTPEGLPTGTVAGAFRLTDHTTFPFSYPVDILDFGKTIQGRYIRLEITSAYPVALGFDFAYAVIGEVVASVEPLRPPDRPTLSITRESNGDVKVTFTGTLQSASGVTGEFIDVPGNPQGAYTIAQTNLSGQLFFRARK
jgi:hypothetical protein